MNVQAYWVDLLTAVQFLTRIPLPAFAYRDDSLLRSLKFFPVIGLLLGAGAAAVYRLFDPHLPRLAVALLVLVFLVGITGCLHEDALADVADGFGGGWNRDQILTILRDSRIGSYGATALALSLASRLVLISSLPPASVCPTLITAHVLCRWTTLPLSYFLAPARSVRATGPDGQGARVAGLTTMPTLIGGTLFSFLCAILLLRWRAFAAILGALLVTLLSGLYYRRRIGGITGDCFGATNQVAEIAVYLCGAWV